MHNEKTNICAQFTSFQFTNGILGDTRIAYFAQIWHFTGRKNCQVNFIANEIETINVVQIVQICREYKTFQSQKFVPSGSLLLSFHP